MHGASRGDYGMNGGSRRDSNMHGAPQGDYNAYREMQGGDIEMNSQSRRNSNTYGPTRDDFDMYAASRGDFGMSEVLPRDTNIYGAPQAAEAPRSQPCCGAMGCCNNNVEESDVRFHDEKFDGPVAERQCRDVFWLILFFIFIIGMVVGISYAAGKGDIDRILNGMDSNGYVCGKNNKEFKLSGGEVRPAIDYTKNTFVDRGSSATAIYKTYEIKCAEECQDNQTSFFNRCIPKSETGKGAGATNVLNAAGNQTTFFKEAAGDVQYCWREILYLALISLGLTIFMMFMLRFLAAILIYLAMITMIVVSIAGTAYTWYQYSRAKKMATDGREEPNRHVLAANAKNWLVGAILATVFCLFFLLMMFVMRKRLKLVIQLFKESGKAVAAMPFILIQPIWTFLIIALIGAAWIYALMWYQSSGDLVEHEKKVYLEKDTFIKIMRWYHVFGLLWLTWFCFGCQNVVIAGAIAKWFFTRDKSQIGSPILTAIWRVMRYHAGSIALGSLIISIIKFIRLLLKFLEKNMRNSRNPNVACMFTLIQCCMKCFENFLKFITRNAYIEIAIYGYTFCKSAKKSFSILVNNSLRVAAINSVGDFALLMCKACVVVTVAFIGMELIKRKDAVSHVWVPVIIACLFAYLIADCFLSVYEMTIDTIFLCFAEDCERNDGINRPYFMSKSLMTFVEGNNQAMPAEGKVIP